MKLVLITPIATLLTVLSVFALAPPAVVAVDVVGPGSKYCEDNDDPSICNPNNDYSNQDATNNVLVGTNGMITRAVQVMVYISGALAMILIIIAGFMYIFSGGNPESTGRARNTIVYAVIGMTIAVAGQLIVLFVLDRL